MAWRNGAGDQWAQPRRTAGARDAGEVAAAVRAAADDGLRVRALGSGHSCTAVDAPDGVARTAPGPAALLADELLANGAHAAAGRAGRAAPRLVPLIDRVAARSMAAAEYVDRSYRVFTSPRRVRFLEMEYAGPRAALPGAFAHVDPTVALHERMHVVCGEEVLDTWPVDLRGW